MEKHSGFRFRCKGCSCWFTRAATTHACDRRTEMVCYKEWTENDVKNVVSGDPAMELYTSYKMNTVPKMITLIREESSAGPSAKESSKRSRSESPSVALSMPKLISPLPDTPGKKKKKAATGSKSASKTAPSATVTKPLIPEIENLSVERSAGEATPPISVPLLSGGEVSHYSDISDDEGPMNLSVPVTKKVEAEKEKVVTVPSEPSEGGSLAASPQITLEDVAPEDIRRVIAKASEGAKEIVNPATEPAEPPPEPGTSSCASNCDECERGKIVANKLVQERVNAIGAYQGKVVRLNVGGSGFSTTVGTLTNIKECVLAQMIVTIPTPTNGWFFIDRDPKHFPLILNFIRRCGKIAKGLLPRDTTELTELLQEAEYFNVPGLIHAVRKRLRS